MNHSHRFIGGKKLIVPVLTQKGKKGSSTEKEGKRKHTNSSRNYGQGSESDLSYLKYRLAVPVIQWISRCGCVLRQPK